MHMMILIEMKHVAWAIYCPPIVRDIKTVGNKLPTPRRMNEFI